MSDGECERHARAILGDAAFEARFGNTANSTTHYVRRAFSILIVSEQKSIGRELFGTTDTIKALAKAGVQIVEYMHGQSLTPRTWIEKTMLAVRAGADEAHTADTRARTYEAHLAKVRKGHLVGGRTFGYRNVDVLVGHDAHGGRSGLM